MSILEKVSAIETSYGGRRFRSRLEARWAVFFDKAGIRWVYESQGYEAADGSRYLPDFWLPDLGVWCEVKGDPAGLGKDYERMCSVLQPGGPLPLVLLSELPKKRGLVLHPVLRFGDQGLSRSWGAFFQMHDGRVELAVEPISPSLGAHMFSIGLGLYTAAVHLEEKFEQKEWDASCAVVENGLRLMNPAYQAASFARFEHGETPSVQVDPSFARL